MAPALSPPHSPILGVWGHGSSVKRVMSGPSQEAQGDKGCPRRLEALTTLCSQPPIHTLCYSLLRA